MIRVRYKIQGRALRLEIPDETVFTPNLVSLLTASQVHVVAGEVVCDIGCGCGLMSVLAAKLGAGRVYGVDLNPAALAASRRNARLNGVADRCVFVRGPWFDRLRGAAFDALICTLPNVRHESAALWCGPQDPRLLRSIDGGGDGENAKVELIRRMGPVLAPRGRLYLSNVGWCNSRRSLEALARERLEVTPLAEAAIAVWGRGNNMREWLLGHQGRHRVEFRARADAGSRAVILVARRPGAAAGDGRKPRVVELAVEDRSYPPRAGAATAHKQRRQMKSSGAASRP